MSKPAKVVSPEHIPEVIEFIDAQDTLNEFKAQHAAIFSQLSVLVERYNAALEHADKTVRAQLVTCGPFQLYQFSSIYDPVKLFNTVGKDKFLALGGKIEEVPQYTLDKKMFEASASQRKVSKEVYEQVVTNRPAYHKPPKFEVP